MADDVVRIARSNPGLSQSASTTFPETVTNSARICRASRVSWRPRSSSLASSNSENFGSRTTGTGYLSHCTAGSEKSGRHSIAGPPGLPIGITSRVNSKIRTLSGLNRIRGFSRMVKRYKKDMRPPGHPGVRKLGFAGLVVCSGARAAGRELRMLVFSMAVICTGAMLVR